MLVMKLRETMYDDDIINNNNSCYDDDHDHDDHDDGASHHNDHHQPADHHIEHDHYNRCMGGGNVGVQREPTELQLQRRTVRLVSRSNARVVHARSTRTVTRSNC